MSKDIQVTAVELKSIQGSNAECTSKCKIEMFRDFLIGAHQRNWTGMVSVDTAYGVKKIYFFDGEIVFASSNIMDDRLGEVIYRESMITLDQMTDSAIKVSRDNKFGQVLLSDGVFDNQSLWTALKLQVRQIVQSVFLVEQVFFDASTNVGRAPTEILFEEGTADMIDDAFGYGCHFRAFRSRLTENTKIFVVAKDWQKRFGLGTFVADLLQLITEQPKVADLMTASKLNEINTVAVLSRLVQSGICRAEDLKQQARVQYLPAFAPVKEKLETYSMMLQSVKAGFVEDAKTFPTMEVNQFALTLNAHNVISFYLNDDASIHHDCIGSMMTQCQINPARVRYFEGRAQSLTRFLLQVAGDNLKFETAKKIRDHYRSLA